MQNLYLLIGENVSKDFPENYNICPLLEIREAKEYTFISLLDYLRESLEDNVSRKELLQIAEDLKELYHDEIFIQFIIRKIIKENLNNVIITDVQYLYECNLLRREFPYLKVIGTRDSLYYIPLDFLATRIN